jgi:hypothetical protein
MTSNTAATIHNAGGAIPAPAKISSYTTTSRIIPNSRPLSAVFERQVARLEPRKSISSNL